MPIDLDVEFDNQDAVAQPEVESAPATEPVIESPVSDDDTQTQDAGEEITPSWFSEIQMAMDNPVIPGVTVPGGPPPPPPGYQPQPPPMYQQPPPGRDPRYQDIDQLFEIREGMLLRF